MNFIIAKPRKKKVGDERPPILFIVPDNVHEEDLKQALGKGENNDLIFGWEFSVLTGDMPSVCGSVQDVLELLKEEEG